MFEIEKIINKIENINSEYFEINDEFVYNELYWLMKSINFYIIK
jgi:hypothetical protein